MSQVLGVQGAGEDATVGELDLTTAHVSFSDLRTRGKTLYVIPGGEVPFDTITVEGQLPGDDVWITVKGTATDEDGNLLDLVIDTSGPGVYIIGADYIGLRVVGAGGSDYVPEVEADPDHVPDPIVGVPEVLASTIDAGII